MPVIFHIDVNSAYLSWTAAEQLKNGAAVDLRSIPSIIGGDKKSRHGVVLAKSIPAKKYGIRTGEPVVNAFAKCPDLTMEPPDHKLYKEYSRRLMDFLCTYTERIEQVSVDECYMDFTEAAKNYYSPAEGAMEIKNRVRELFGFTVNVGISSNKLLAKMASDFQKPDRVYTLYPHEIEEKMWPLPVWLKSILKKQGETIWGFANGIDLSLVLARPVANKGYGNSTTTPYDVTDLETAKRVLLSLCETIGNRLRTDHAGHR